MAAKKLTETKDEDLDWLKKFIDKNGTDAVQVSDKAGNKISTTQFLSEITADTPDSELPATTVQEKLHKKAKKLEVADPEREQEVADAAARQEIEEQNAERIQNAQDLRDRVNATVGNVGNSVSPLIDKAGALPTLGGIGLLLGILAVLLFLVVRVNAQGDTRAKQFWYMLTGKASLQGAVKPEGVVNPKYAAEGVTIMPGGATSSFGTTVNPNSSNGAFTTDRNIGP